MNKNVACWIVTSVLLWVSMLCVGQEPAEQEPSISFGPIESVTGIDRPDKPREFTVTVEPAGEGTPRHFTVRGPYKLLDLDEKPRGWMVDDRLLVTTSRVITVFDLKTGEEVFYSVAAPRVVVSEAGRRVAFVTLQLKFLPVEATSSVIQVIDVPSLQIEPVFPESSTIQVSSGRLIAWVDEPADRHTASDLYFSPDGSRLAFFCGHGGSTMPDVPRELYLVVVDLSRGVGESCFSHLPFDWEEYLRPGVALGERKPHFVVESLEWRDDDTVVVRTPDQARWFEEEIVIELPDPDDWPAPDEPSKDKEP